MMYTVASRRYCRIYAHRYCSREDAERAVLAFTRRNPGGQYHARLVAP